MDEIDACPLAHHLVAFVDGKLDATSQEVLERHFDVCVRCMSAVSVLAGLATSSGASDELESSTEEPPSPALEVEPGSLIGRYRVNRLLGVGGMGEVYAAFDPQLGRDVALKLLRFDDGDLGQRQARLLYEAQVMARLSHPNVLTVHDVGVSNDRLFIAMEWVKGETLRQWLKRPHPRRELVRVFRSAAEGLSAAHEAGVVHRDFKPENVLLGQDGRVRVMDFGLARSTPGICDEGLSINRAIDARSGEARRAPLDEGGRESPPLTEPPSLPPGNLTLSGAAVGTPVYMAPEQFLGHTDARSDQFAFCVTLYEALHGERPFPDGSMRELRTALAKGELRPLSRRRRVPAALRRLALRGLLRDPERRHPSMKAVAAALERQERRGPRLAMAGVAALALLLVAGGEAALRWRDTRCSLPQHKFDGIWDAARSAKIAKAFRDTGVPYAEASWRAVERALSAYAGAWPRRWGDACQATYVKHEQSERILDLRVACLESRREEARALSDLFSTADARVVENSVEAVGRLRELDDCQRLLLLAMRADPPKAPAARAALDALVKPLARAKTLRDAGRFQEGLKLARSLIEPAQKVHYRPVEAEALFRAGELSKLVNEPDRAEPLLFDALAAAQAGGDLSLVARAAIQLASLKGAWQHLYPESARWAQLAEGTIEQLGGDALLSAELARTRSYVAYGHGDAAETRRWAERALELHPVQNGADLALAGDLQLIAFAEERAGRYPEAIAIHRRELSILESAFGPSHPKVADALASMGPPLVQIGELEEALAIERRSLAIREAVEGPVGPEVAYSLLGVVSALHAAERYQEALPLVRRARTMLTAPSLALESSWAEADEGWIDVGLERAVEAERLLSEALAIEEREVGSHHTDLCPTLEGLGEAAWLRGDPRKALALFQRAASLLQANASTTNLDLAEALHGVGESYRRLADFTPATEVLERVLAMRSSGGADPVVTADTRFSLAQSLLGSNRARARTLAEEAREVYSAHRRAASLAKVERWLRTAFARDRHE